MRWATYLSPSDGLEHPGLIHQGAVHGLRGADQLVDILGDLEVASERALADPLEVIGEADVRYVAPIPAPPSVRDFMAFEEHIVTSMKAVGMELDAVWYELPVFYFSNPAAVLGPHDDVPISPGCAQFDFELEVAVVIGREGRDLDPETALEHVAGYTVFCDWSARDLQFEEMRLGLGPAKGKDTANSFGPWLVTPDELPPGGAPELRMTASVNGTPYSSGTLSDLYWDFGTLLAYASRGTRLVPGDVIGSGTVGTGCILELSRVHGADRFPWLAAGDVVRLEVEHLGAIEAAVVPGPDPLPLTPRRSAPRGE